MAEEIAQTIFVESAHMCLRPWQQQRWNHPSTAAMFLKGAASTRQDLHNIDIVLVKQTSHLGGNCSTHSQLSSKQTLLC